MRDISKAKLPPITGVLLIQAVVYAALYFLLPSIEELLGHNIPLFWQMLAQGAIAACVTWRMSYGCGWIVGQFVAPPLLVLFLALGLPVWVFPVVIALLVLVFWNVASNRVPLYLTNNETAQAIESYLPTDKPLHFADLGSGLGGTLRHLARARPNSHFIGLETAPIPFVLSWIMGKASGQRNLDFRFQNIWKQDLGAFDVVYCFLSPVPMPRLYEKMRAELKPGSLFISNSFAVPEQDPDEIIEVSDRRQTRLLIWKT